MEVLQAFDVSSDLKNGLSLFASWMEGFGLHDKRMTMGDAAQEFHEKHQSARTRWTMPPNFPADNVIHAYMNPVVDKSNERFTWGVPNVEGLVVFCAKHIGWPPEETRNLLAPVIAKSGTRYRQTRIDSFMKYEDGIKFANVRSKRLRAVLETGNKDKKKTQKRTKNA